MKPKNFTSKKIAAPPKNHGLQDTTQWNQLSNINQRCLSPTV